MNSISYFLKMINPFGYGSGNGVEKLKEKLAEMYSNPDIFILKNGRTALYLFLKSLKLSSGSKVAIQAFTCNAVVNPILWNGLEPLYIDIDPNNFSMDIKDLEKKLDSAVKVLILQHTFGLSANLKIVKYCKQRGITVIEDCAHTFGNVKVGKDGDATMFSFGFEKVLSSRVGGALMVNNKGMVEGFRNEYNEILPMKKEETFLWLLNPVLWRLLRNLPNSISSRLGKIFVDFGLLNRGFSRQDKGGDSNVLVPQGLSSVLASVVYDCLSALDVQTQHRNEISSTYSNLLGLNFFGALLRYPYICSSYEEANLKIEKISKIGFPLEDKWFYPVVFPRDTNLTAMKYVNGSCPVAESISAKIINLPTNLAVTTEIATKICNLVLEK